MPLFAIDEESLTVVATWFDTIKHMAEARAPTTPSEIEFQLNDWLRFALKTS
jgi:hypothetical protein